MNIHVVKLNICEYCQYLDHVSFLMSQIIDVLTIILELKMFWFCVVLLNIL
jgi:hypothetical protein